MLAEKKKTKADQIYESFEKTRTRSRSLCAPLKIEDYIPQPAEFVSPPKWHLAHSTWFFEEMILKKFKDGYKEFNSEFAFLFNSYYRLAGEKAKRTERGNITRPGVKEVYRYREYVEEEVRDLLNSNPGDEIIKLIVLGINHEQQHQELLVTDLKYTLGQNPVFPIYDPKVNLVNGTNSENGWLKIQEGIYEIGNNSKEFSYDNELQRHRVFLESFEISRSLVTNEEYMEFMNDGGYSKFQLWLDEGWNWRKENNITSPMYWYKINDDWFYYTLSGLKPINPKALLSHVSFYEAYAYAMWKGMRLPTEFEWEAASGGFTWGKRWEWTYSAYLPYPGFKIAEGAIGEYNGKFMVNQMVMRGASVVTADGHSRNTYRNFFHPHHQWQFSGIRLAR